MDGEEVGPVLVDSAENESGTDLALVSGAQGVSSWKEEGGGGLT